MACNYRVKILKTFKSINNERCDEEYDYGWYEHYCMGGIGPACGPQGDRVVSSYPADYYVSFEENNRRIQESDGLEATNGVCSTPNPKYTQLLNTEKFSSNNSLKIFATPKYTKAFDQFIDGPTDRCGCVKSVGDGGASVRQYLAFTVMFTIGFRYDQLQRLCSPNKLYFDYYACGLQGFYQQPKSSFISLGQISGIDTISSSKFGIVLPNNIDLRSYNPTMVQPTQILQYWNIITEYSSGFVLDVDPSKLNRLYGIYNLKYSVGALYDSTGCFQNIGQTSKAVQFDHVLDSLSYKNGQSMPPLPAEAGT